MGNIVLLEDGSPHISFASYSWSNQLTTTRVKQNGQSRCSTRWWSSTQRKEEDTQRVYGEADKEREYREGGRSASKGPEMEVRGAIGEI